MTKLISEYLAVAPSAPPNPLFALVAGLICVSFAGALFWPRYGLVSIWTRTRMQSLRILCEDALKHIEKACLDERRPTIQSLGGALQINLNKVAAVVDELVKRELVVFNQAEIRLTPSGRAYALNIIRAHRLWERYLSEETGLAESEWHDHAELHEHRLSPEDANALAVRLGDPKYDPHGDPIPTAEGDLIEQKGEPLSTLAPGQMAKIVHIEDEPESVYAQLSAEGLTPGIRVRLVGVTAQRVRFRANEKEHALAPVLAANVFVSPLASDDPAALDSVERLSMLAPGKRATVRGISLRCRGAERRRLVGLGILPGTEITAEVVSPSGDPTAYRIRGALIALRSEQADMIETFRVAEPALA